MKAYIEYTSRNFCKTATKIVKKEPKFAFRNSRKHVIIFPMSKPWHSFSLEKTFKELESRPAGLTEAEANQRLKKFGPNRLPQEKPYSKIRLFLNQFNSPLMYILLVSVAISFSLKHYSDTIFIAIVLLINTTVGFYQENKASRALAVLKKMVKIRARVLRGGNEKEIDSEELVAGDVAFLKPGDKVPADGRIIDSRGLKINEASLTGESEAIEKKSLDALGEDTILPERANMVFMGAIVEEGQGTIVITATAVDTQIGKIVSLLKKTKERKTPLQKKIVSLSKILGAFILFVVFVVFIIGYFTLKPFADIFITSLALVVSAIPEGLLAIITVILVLGMRRILKQKGLVRKLVATEALGSVTVICTDKTGTLTEGKMKVSHILTSAKELLGDGINGTLREENVNGAQSHILALKIATMVNDAFVENPEAELQEWIARGSPTEKALLFAGMQAGLDKKELESRYRLIDRIFFKPEHKYAANLYKTKEQKYLLYAVGAPEEIIGRSVNLDINSRIENLGGGESKKLIKKSEELAGKGLRVLACAYRNYGAGPINEEQNLAALIKDLTLVGFIALKDPLRQDAKEAVMTTKRAGIRTIIVTGDHKLTARTIAKEIGLEAEDRNILEGKEIETIDDAKLQELAKHVSIYARVSPRHKLRIVGALRSNGEVVAMLGDGVNDAPALKSADIGVAVGSGADVAKEVADLVLLDDNFRTVVGAIEQGRIVFENIRKVFVYLIADDFSEIFLFLASVSMGLPLPLLPAQILWINIVEDGFPGIGLTVEQETKGVMGEKPRNPKEPILNKSIKLWMTAIFFITGIAAFLFFLILLKTTGDLLKTRTMVFALMCVDSLIFAFCVRSFKRTIFRKDIFANRYLAAGVMIGAILLAGAVYLPPLQKLLDTRPLDLNEWLIIFGISAAEIMLIEFSKKRFFKNKVLQ